MTNNTVKGTKKSNFIGNTLIPSGTTFDFVTNGQNQKILDSDLYTALNVTGTIVQEGDPSGTPILDKQGATNAIRSITAGFGISSVINPYNGVTFATDFTFNQTGVTLVDDTTASAALWRSIVGGAGVSAVGSAGVITISSDVVSIVSGSGVSVVDTAGVITISSDITGNVASQLEYFNKSATKLATPSNIALDYRVQNFHIENSTGAVSSVIAAGGSLNVNTLLLEAGESSLGVVPAFKNVSNVAQATFTDETNDKFLFPSNLNTFNNVYSIYQVRANIIVSHPVLTTTQNITITASLKRVSDNSIVVSDEYTIQNHAADSGRKLTFNQPTYVNSETDPYVVGGVYFDISTSALSSGSLTVTGVDFVVFKI
jgi:hypothetical protein